MEVIQDKEEAKNIENHITARNTKSMGPDLSHMEAEAMATKATRRLMLSPTVGHLGWPTAQRTRQHME